MDITSAQYVRDIYGENYAINIVVGGKTFFCVPPSQNNTDYQAVLEWAEEDGNEIQAAE